jgi:hypothetical protein
VTWRYLFIVTYLEIECGKERGLAQDGVDLHDHVALGQTGMRRQSTYRGEGHMSFVRTCFENCLARADSSIDGSD